MKIYNKEVKLRSHYCALFDKAGEKAKPYINLYVRTKGCNAACKFCNYHSDANKWNGEKYKEIIKYLYDIIEIRKIGVSGGEPTLRWDDFMEISEFSKDYTNELSLNTNGYNLNKLFDNVYKLYDYIQISRHHYDDKLNNEILGTTLPTSDEIKSIVKLQTHKHQIQFRTNLIKGYIDNKDEVFKFLDWSNEIGINDIGLVSLMPINEYSKEKFIYFHIKELINDNFFLTKKWNMNDVCECFNYVYLPENSENQIRVYHKNTFKPQNMVETLVYDGQNLTLGFGGEIIY